MEILKKFSIFKGKSKKDPGNILIMANAVSTRIDKMAWDVFSSFRMELLAKPITYIVPAIWGTKKDGELTPLQERIHARVNTQIDEIFGALQIKELTDAQEFAVKYLIRDLVISKIAYMIESFRVKLDATALSGQFIEDYLKNIEPKGNA
jgi:hypothetical protein